MARKFDPLALPHGPRPHNVPLLLCRRCLLLIRRIPLLGTELGKKQKEIDKAYLRALGLTMQVAHQPSPRVDDLETNWVTMLY